jgi:hypothetical protein
MGIEGNLQTMALADLLQWLSNGHYTGTLLVSNGQIVKSIFFKDGQIISCTSTNPKEFLGHFLVSHGYITEEQLVSAVSEQDRSRELLGSIMVEQGLISTGDLEKMLRLKAEESIFELFQWTDGQFRFVNDELPKYTMVPISLDVTGLLLEGMRRIDEWARIRDVVSSAHCVPVAVGELLEGEEDDARRAVLAMVDDDRSVEDICLQTHSGEFFVCDILFQKVKDGKLKVVRPRGLVGEAELPATSAESLMVEARDHLAGKDYEQALRRLRAAGNLEPDNRDLLRDIRAGENEIRAELETAGVDPAGIPSLKSSLEDLGSKSFTPEEGFILSRINGVSDLASIMKISPLPELEARIVFWKLIKEDLIQLRFS